MPPVGFEPTISAGARPQTYALDRAVTGSGDIYSIVLQKCIRFQVFTAKNSNAIFSGEEKRQILTCQVKLPSVKLRINVS